jgi:hypothetical protein
MAMPCVPCPPDLKTSAAAATAKQQQTCLCFVLSTCLYHLNRDDDADDNLNNDEKSSFRIRRFGIDSPSSGGENWRKVVVVRSHVAKSAKLRIFLDSHFHHSPSAAIPEGKISDGRTFRRRRQSVFVFVLFFVLSSVFTLHSELCTLH